MKFNKLLTIIFTVFALANITAAHAEDNNKGEDEPAEISIGERLFLETRFSQAYYAHPWQADPVMDKTVMFNSTLRGPFAGKTMNCRACHMVDEHAKNPVAGIRSYADFASRPPVPRRDDHAVTSARNSMSMVNISISRQHGTVFHYDGEFDSMEDLVRGTLTGRNYGWMPKERALAIQHIARIIRADNGMGELAKEFGGSYRKVFTATSEDLAKKFRLPATYRLNVDTASDQAIFNLVAKLVSAYVTDLNFSRDEQGIYNGSPYDEFLKINNLPRKAGKNESLSAYSQRLIKAVEAIKSPKFVMNSTRKFVSHKQKFLFSEKELRGMKLFFSKGSHNTSGGNCISCHTAPHFSDFGFHNTGLAQQNYDALHGNGALKKLHIPGLKERNQHPDNFLPATSLHPEATSRFRSIASKNKPGYTDLGLWNIFANPDMPRQQQKLKKILCSQRKPAKVHNCDTDALLETAIAAFKTPVLRDLGHSNPYMHTGQFPVLEQAIRFYISSSTLAKNNLLRNPEPALKDIKLANEDIEPLLAFLKSLNEDYE